MSKSKGNVIDPIEIINIYGSDALRYTLANLSTQGQDIKLSNKVVENSRNFITKIWNVARFSQFNKFSYEKNFSPELCKLSLNIWILSKFSEIQKKVIKNLESSNLIFLYLNFIILFGMIFVICILSYQKITCKSKRIK